MRRRRLNAITQSKSVATRLVNSVVATPVVTKRYFLPSSLPGCQLWLDATDNSSLVMDGTNVTTWRDKSGNGYHMNTLTQTAGWTGTAAYPTIGTSINGLQTVNFKAQGGLKQSTTLDGVKNLFWVGRIEAPTGSGSENCYFLFGHDWYYDWHGTPYGGRFVDGTNAEGGIYNGTTSLFTSDANAVTNTSLGAAFKPTAPNVSLLSVAGISGNTRYQGICYDRNGGHIGWCGDLAEVITFSTALTTAQRQAVEGYLAHKWGITQYYSPTTPLSIPGCSIWLDAADPTSLTLSGSTVTTWRDKSGNGNNFTSVIGSTSVTTDNGMNVVNFSANDAVMRSTNQVPLTTSSAIFVVSKLLSINSSTFSYILALPDILGWDDYSFRYRDGSSLIGTRAYGGGGVDGDIGNGNYYVNGVFDPTGGGQFLNKYSVISTIKPGRSGTTRVLLSSSSSGRYFKGYIAEFLYYSGGVTLSQRETIEKYLMQKWGLGLLPLSHPYANFIPSPLTEFIPKSITGCALWLDAADTSSITLSGTNVTEWKDKSGNQNNSTSCTATYVSGINGRATMNNPVISGPIANSGSSTVSVFVIASNNRIGNPYDNMIALNVSPITNYYASGSLFIARAGDNTNPQLYYGFMNGFPNGDLVATFSAAFNTGFMFNVFQTGTTGTTYGNGTNYGSLTTRGATFNYTHYYIGTCTGGPAWIGNIGEVLIYNKDLTTTERQQVESYLTLKWGLNPSLPVNHPYKAFSSYSSLTNTFLPTLIPGCALWLDGADPGGGGIQPANGTVLSSWNDKSGFGRHATTAGTGPTYTANSFNRFSAPVFNLTPLSTPSYLISSNSKLSVFMLCKKTGVVPGGGNSDILSLNGWQYFDIFIETSANQYLSLIYTNGLTTFSNQAVSNGTDLFITLITNGSSRNGFLNGTSVFNSSTPDNGYSISADNVNSRWNISAASFVGAICEIIVYNDTLTATQRQQVESYLAWKWGVQDSLPSDHTYKFAPPSV